MQRAKFHWMCSMRHEQLTDLSKGSTFYIPELYWKTRGRMEDKERKAYDIAMKKAATYALNSRAGKHKVASKAQRRAMLLGQMAFFVQGALGTIRSLMNETQKNRYDTDLPQATVDNLIYPLNQAMYSLTIAREEIKAVTKETSAPKKQPKEKKDE